MRAAAFIAVALLALAGCGNSRGIDRPGGEASLLLDFTPNAVHVGIYTAIARGYDDAEGVALEVRAPTQGGDSVRLLATGAVDLAILDIHDLALARERGRDLVGVMALVQRPLAALIAQPDVRRPRALEGRRVGVAGLPSDDAVLRSIVAGDGGDPDRVRAVTIGFNAVQALLGRRVAAATAFWSAEGVALRRERPGMREFRVDDFGAPRYPELVLAATRATLDESPARVRAAVRAIGRGYREARVDPESAIAALTDAIPGLERELVAQELDAVGPAFTAGARGFGELSEVRLRAWAAWEARFGITREPPDVALAFEPRIAALAASAGRDP